MTEPPTTVRVLVDGVPGEGVPATDSSVLRGDGCFEAVRSYDGRLFRLDDHLDRLALSAEALGLELPDRNALTSWMGSVAHGDCIVRVVATRGSAVPGDIGRGRCVVVAHPLPARHDNLSLWPVAAPWHPAGRAWELAGVKTISYAPNLAAGRLAMAQGATDALLVSESGIVLEGPTFSVGWVRDGEVFTPARSLGILDSITRRVAFELWPGIEEAVAPIDVLYEADEVFAMSTVKEIAPVVRVGAVGFGVGPVALRLSQLFAELVGQLDTSSQPR